MKSIIFMNFNWAFNLFYKCKHQEMYLFFLSMVNYGITNYEKYYKTIIQPAILTVLWIFAPDCVILSRFMRSIPDGTPCAMPNISCMLFSINLYNSFLLGFETHTFWRRNINEPLLKPLDQGDSHGKMYLTIIKSHACNT